MPRSYGLPSRMQDAQFCHQTGVERAVGSYFTVKEPLRDVRSMQWLIYTDFDGGYDDRGSPTCIAHHSCISEQELHMEAAAHVNSMHIEHGKQSGHAIMNLLINSAIFERRTRKHWLYRTSVWVSRRSRKFSDFLFATNRFAWYYWMKANSTTERDTDGD